MPTKTKRFAELLFRRSSSSSSGGAAKPREICYQHQNFAHYENLMKPNGMGGVIVSVDRDDDQSIDSMEDHSVIVPLVLPILRNSNVDRSDNCRAENLSVFKDRHQRMCRARSASPGKVSSILKSSTRGNGCENYQSNAAGSSTLQRTKSNPNPPALQKLKRKPIPVKTPTVPKRESENNPLLSVSWDAATLEKQKDMILNFFKTFSTKEPDNSSAEPLYEEIRDSNCPQFDSIKPKITPKKVRLNLQPIYVNDLKQTAADAVYNLPANDKIQHLHTFKKSETSISSENSQNASSIPTLPQSTQADTQPEGTTKTTPTIIPQRLSLTNFATQRAPLKIANNRSHSFNLGLLNNSQLVSSSNYSEKIICDMDEIYLRLDKRGKKAGSPTTRLLKRHQSISAFNNRAINPKSKPCRYNLPLTPSSSSPIIAAKTNRNRAEEANEIYVNYVDNDKRKQPIYQNSLQFRQDCSTLEEGTPGTANTTKEVDISDVDVDGDFLMVGRREEDASLAHNLKIITASSRDSCYYSASEGSSEESESKGGSISSKLVATSSESRRSLWDAKKEVAPAPAAAPTTIVQVNNNFVTNVNVESVSIFETETEPIGHIGSVLTISVIDSTQSNPTSCSYPVESETTVGNSSRPSGFLDLWKYISLRKGTVLDDSSVFVIHQTPKRKGESSESTRNKNSKPEIDADAITIMSSTAFMTTIKDDKLSSELLIETQTSWDSSSPSPSTSPNSSENTSSSPSSSRSDTSESPEICVHVETDMAEPEAPSPTRAFIRQASKYNYEDVDGEEDGGFESFQVVDGSFEDEISGSGSEDGQFLGISENTAHRQRTFAQLSQNIPEKELSQKASSVLDLINQEISDLHMRELELKKKNRVADQKQQEYENEVDSEDLVEVEGSSQADSDEYSDSAVDVESYSRTSGMSSGNITPADKRDDSPLSSRGSYHPAEVEADAKGELVEREEVVHLITTTATSSSVKIADEDASGGTGGGSAATLAATKQQGVKVRPIVEEEVKSIELSVTKETPIEREIRLVREREDEFRRQRLPSSPSVESPTPLLESPVTPKISTNFVKAAAWGPALAPAPERKVSVGRSTSVSTVKSVFNGEGTNFSAPGPKDIQYEMATARLKREMEENLMRERELFREGRLKSLSAPEQEIETAEEESVVSEDAGSSTPSNEYAESETFEEPSPAAPQPQPLPQAFGRKSLVRLSSTPGGNSSDSSKTSSPVPQSAPAIGSMRFFAPAGFQHNNSTSSTLIKSAFSKPQFTSIEKMILKGSFSFSKNKNTIQEEPQRHVYEEVRIGTVEMMPDPLQIVQRVETTEETEGGGGHVEERPRRKYVPAQDKIQIELQEQVKREKELSQLRAKWKSTPDLSKSEEMQDANEDEHTRDEGLTKPSALKRQMSASTQRLSIASDEVTTNDVLKMNKPVVRRRHSALINQWEEMIKQQQQKHNKN